ncbi:MAG TPA: glucoamylase family protein, partial [Candidatus Binatia bacterium]|nr:glucoamylase family protein [Candidatus Binatia bacterium]
ANLTVLLTLTLLAHQTLLSLDAVGRALVRRLVTRERLLEWESAAESELKKKRSPIDRYIDWMPFLAAGLGVLIWLTKPHSLLAALPILFLWACAKPLAMWLNASPIHPRPEPARRDVLLLRRSALYIWRYFAEFSSAEHHWLIPDNVQDDPRKIAARVSPTNIGLLLNARQVANELGYITVPEMIDLTEKTLGTLENLPKYRGHIMNWYETRTGEPKSPQFISSVDNGNLLASLWTLQQGCIERLHQPLISWSLAEGLLDHLRALVRLGAFPKRELKLLQAELQNENWLASVLNFPEELLREEVNPEAKRAGEIDWFRGQALARVKNIRSLVLDYMPWLLSDFDELSAQLTAGPMAITKLLPLGQLPDGIAVLLSRLDENFESMQNGNQSTAQRLKVLLSIAHQNAVLLVDSVRQTSQQAHDLAEAMDFTFLLDKQRLLMSVGFDADSKKLVPYYYDLLATEPRTAVFVAIAKDDIPQDAWFRLDRPFANEDGRTVLLSWTGTMFEYLMPTIWMRSYANTLLDRAGLAAVRTQQAYAASKGIPWGISESASARRNEEDEYHYEAFGVPNLALKKNEIEPLIISPYSTFLALNVDEKNALANLRRMDSMGWFGPYGFFEAADYTRHRKRFGGAPRFELVRSWMVHHQGMALLSLGNFLCDNVVQDWFHSDRRVRATELLLQGKPVSRPA